MIVFFAEIWQLLGFLPISHAFVRRDYQPRACFLDVVQPAYPMAVWRTWLSDLVFMPDRPVGIVGTPERA